METEAEAVLDALTARLVARCYCGADVHAGCGKSLVTCLCGREWFRIAGGESGWEQWARLSKSGRRLFDARGQIALTIYDPGTPNERTEYGH